MKEVSAEYRYTIEEAVTATIEVTKCVFKFYVLMPWIGIALLLFCASGVFIFNWSLPDLAAAGAVGDHRPPLTGVAVSQATDISADASHFFQRVVTDDDLARL